MKPLVLCWDQPCLCFADYCLCRLRQQSHWIVPLKTELPSDRYGQPCPLLTRLVSIDKTIHSRGEYHPLIAVATPMTMQMRVVICEPVWKL